MTSVDDINERLQWYIKTYNTENDQSMESIDIIAQLSLIEKVLKEKELYMCTRELQCRCKSEETCICDDDIDIQITSITCDLGSNCSFSIVLHYRNHTLQMPKNKILRIFHFIKSEEGSGEDEIVAFDIIPGKEDTQVVFHFTQPKLTYSIAENITRGKGYVSFTFNYMNYNQ